MPQKERILVTGGAGFIGSFLTDELIKSGYRVRIFDNLEEQVHHGRKPAYLNKKAEFIKGDIRNYEVMRKAVRGCDVIFHLAAAVGVAQSQYEIKKYTDVNVGGTANLLDILVKDKMKVKKVIVMASMTGYGEGAYRCATDGVVRPGLRENINPKKDDWDPHCPVCGKKIKPVPIDENASMELSSLYALTKRIQEDLVLTVGATYKIPVAAVRGFNIYGPRQSLSNPYTGVSAIFMSRLKNGQAPMIYEDGLQSRDFVSVHDLVRALILIMRSPKANYQVFNVGSGKGVSVKAVAEIVARLLNVDRAPEITNQFRNRDIRHCVADIGKIEKLLGWKPRISFEEGMKELILWGKDQNAVDTFSKAHQELKKKGILQ